MSKAKGTNTPKVKPSKAVTKKKSAPLGRKRDESLDGHIIETAINILAEVGFDRMTMDMVAAKAKTGKASMYRRWPSKADLVRDALIWMSHTSVELSSLPDTGSLREDLLAVLKPYSLEHHERKFRVLSGLGSFFSEHKKQAEATLAAIFEPITNVNSKIMTRALERGELSPQADIDLACQVIISMISYRTQTLNKPFDKRYYSTLLDGILLPALKNNNS